MIKWNEQGFKSMISAMCHVAMGYGDWNANFRLNSNNDVLSLFALRLRGLLQLLLSAERVGTNRLVHCTQGRLLCLGIRQLRNFMLTITAAFSPLQILQRLFETK
jgi:hypothetical protein